MSLDSIKIALETAIKAGFPTTKIVWENVSTNPPTDGSLYFLVNLLPATPENPTLGDGFYREIGLMQITICAPIDKGSGKLYTKAEEIRTLFKRGYSFTNSGYTVVVSKTPTIGPGMRQEDRFILPVRIQYFVNVMG